MVMRYVCYLYRLFPVQVQMYVQLIVYMRLQCLQARRPIWKFRAMEPRPTLGKGRVFSDVKFFLLTNEQTFKHEHEYSFLNRKIDMTAIHSKTLKQNSHSLNHALLILQALIFASFVSMYFASKQLTFQIVLQNKRKIFTKIYILHRYLN